MTAATAMRIPGMLRCGALARPQRVDRLQRDVDGQKQKTRAYQPMRHKFGSLALLRLAIGTAAATTRSRLT